MDDMVCFFIRDAYLPEPPEVLQALTPETEIVGVVVALSDEGTKQDVFATVEINGTHHVVVPVSKLRHVAVEKPSSESRLSGKSA